MGRFFRPIPRQLLPHTVTLKKVSGTDTYNKKTFSPILDITKVRVEFKKERRTATNGEHKNFDVVLVFYDKVNSITKYPITWDECPFAWDEMPMYWNGTFNDFEFVEGDVMVYRNKEYTIDKVDELWVDNKFHHYEIRCR